MLLLIYNMKKKLKRGGSFTKQNIFINCTQSLIFRKLNDTVQLKCAVTSEKSMKSLVKNVPSGNDDMIKFKVTKGLII